MAEALLTGQSGGKKPVGTALSTDVVRNKTFSTPLGYGLRGSLDIEAGSYVPELKGWIPRTVEESSWRSVCYGNGLFVAVAISGTNRVMTSPDGITWTPRTVEASEWWSVCYGNGLFVAVAATGTNNVMTSPDGITWSPRTVTARPWYSVCYGNGLFVAVANYGTNRVMTSPDGITWTPRTVEESSWRSVCYGNGFFVAVANSGTNRVMTSTDGITWTPHTVEASAWYSVCYGNGLFVAVANYGINRVTTSPDGITWTTRKAEESDWRCVCCGNGLFVAVANNGTNRVMTSPDGITWSPRTVTASSWYSVCYGNGLFVAVANYGTNRVMTSDVVREIVEPKIVLDTSDANAIKTDIILGKTAYVDGVKVVGTFQPIVNLVNSISYTGTYANANSFTQSGCRVGFNTNGEVLVVIQGGDSTSYENVIFTLASAPSGIALVTGSSSFDTSDPVGNYYVGTLTGVTQPIDITVDFDNRNSTYDWVRANLTVTYA